MEEPLKTRVIVESPACSSMPRPREGEWHLSQPAFIDLMRATLAKGVPFKFRARGSSMHPFIKDGDLVTVSPLKAHSPGVGDVVAFVQRETEKLVVHRAIRINANSYFMKGDATAGGDSPVPAANALGMVTKVKRGNKRVFIGLGPERFIIAMLARKGLVIPVVYVAAKLFRPIRSVMTILLVPFQRTAG
jgi:signal peptidase I